MGLRMIAGLTSGLLAALTTAFTNPIIPGFNPDPSIVRVGDDYFLATSTFEFFPGVPIYHSRDLVSWTVVSHALSRPSQLNLRGTAPSGGVFAPTLRYHEGLYYLITTVFDVISPPDNVTRVPRSLFVTSPDPFDDAAWSDPTYVDQWGFDGDLFWHRNGSAFLTSTFSEHVESGNFANWISELDVATGDALSNSRVLHTTTVPKELGYPLTEGSHLYNIRRKDGEDWIYMITADSGTEYNHKSNVYRAKDLAGPWEENPHNPVLWNGRNMSLPVLSTGHADWVEDKEGNWWAVFLATRPQNPSNSKGFPQLGRETFLAPVTWDEDGWPLFNEGEPITTDMPGLLHEVERPSVWRDDFDGAFKDKGYYTPRTPYKEFRDFTSRQGVLRLKGNVYTLSDRETPACALRKQDAVNVTFSTELVAFEPETSRQEAGVTIYLSIHFHDEIAVTAHPETGKRCVVVHTRTGEEATLNTTYVEDAEVAAGAKVRLYIEARSEGYRLGYSTTASKSAGAGKGSVKIRRDGGRNETETESEAKYLAFVENRWLQSYVSGWQNFVGSHIGIYTTGTALPTLNPADFEYIQMEYP